ncbi:MAG: hypothetical protein JST75_03960 [Bacteroidetes bacterium]|nr:hypothetical protein [Bacteroidota bacterium]
MLTLTLSDIQETGYTSISLFLAYCDENVVPLNNNLHRFSYKQNDSTKFIDLPFNYEELKRAAKKEMLREINRAGFDEFVNLKRKIILDNAFDAPLYKLEYAPPQNDHASKTAIYIIHKDLLFRFVQEETLQRA